MEERRLASAVHLYKRYVEAADFRDGPRNFTISRAEVATLGQGDEKKDQVVLYVEESDEKRGFPLNKTRWESCIELFGTDDHDQWVGNKFRAVFNPSVMFAGKKVGGWSIVAPA